MNMKFVCQNCGKCCGPVPITAKEWLAIQKAIRRMPKGEQTRLRKQSRPSSSCPFRDIENKRCSVYAARPEICRMQGEYEGLICPHQPERAIGTRDEGHKRLFQTNFLPKMAGILGVNLGWNEVGT